MIMYFICKFLKLTRVRTYLVLPDKTFKRYNFRIMPNIVFFKSEKKYYRITNIVSEIINETLIYVWVNTEDFDSK
jgi:hypothetical protein